MNDNTINNDMTMGGGATGTLLAGRYRVVRPLGQGGMGSVWLAEDEKLDGFKVAIKMLPSVLVNNKRAYAQVKAEALVSLKLSHPNLVTVRAFEEEGGSPFLVMDYIDGRTLDDYLAEKGKLTEEETVKLLKPVAAALDYAHTQGVVHRDVKPGNVMIRRDGTPFVLDFGIAREIQETMTRVTGKLSSGTLMYMSPEQLNGSSPKPAQDIYSFAAMAYECLKGEPPFSRGQIEYQIIKNRPDPLPGNSAIFHRVMAGLAKAPEARPATCAAVLAVGSCVPCDRIDDGIVADGMMSAAYGLAAFTRIVIGGLLFALVAMGGWWLFDRINLSITPAGGGSKSGDRRPITLQDGVQLWENGPCWAECNVGATRPEEAGYYFGWGDTVGYRRERGRWVAADGSRTGYEFNRNSNSTYGMSDSELRSRGYLDTSGNLVANYDAATAHFGAPWRMPTGAEFKALADNCDTEWTTRNGVAGRLVKGRGAYSSRSIFLPAASCGYDSRLGRFGLNGDYWSSTPHSHYSSSAYLYFDSSNFGRCDNYRYYGMSVRPVREFAQ